MAADLLVRSANLPELVTITRVRSLPALVLAWQLYGDTSRAGDLVTRADPVNALFMPIEVEVPIAAGTTLQTLPLSVTSITVSGGAVCTNLSNLP